MKHGRRHEIMEIIRAHDMEEFTNPGVTSHQVLHPGNSPSACVTITRVVIEPGAVNARHVHAGAEQVWLALSGSGELLLAAGATAPFAEGDVARFAAGDVHGFRNLGAAAFVYLSVTTPPLDFRGAYRSHSPGAR